MTLAPHIPVLLAEMLAAIAPMPGDVIVDGTFGAGGYSSALLRAADCQVIAIDRDPDALAEGQALVDRFAPRLTLIDGRFGELDRLAADHAPVQGVVLDIGVSSMQLDRSGRGFSFLADGPLDMRMAQTGETAADVVNGYDEGEIADILYYLGEETRSRRIAKAIVERRTERPFETTTELASLIASIVPGGKKHPATKSFQALRIHVNAELDELDRGLCAAERVLAPGGRLAVISFHSLEDRRVKTFLAQRSGRRPAGSRHRPMAADQGPSPSFRLAKTGAVKPGVTECQANPRARSARLRMAVRTEAPAWGADL